MRQLWESGYSIKTLYARLLVDEALNPDTMDQRRGAWGQLLAAFRLVHDGHEGFVARRGGKLFDPDAFAFLEGRTTGSPREAGAVLPVSDGTVLRILHGLMTIEGRSFGGERVRERLSYRALDVESIGSVYETVMGFTAKRATEPMVALKDEKKLPTFVGLDSLLVQKPADRQKALKELSVSLSTRQAKAVKEAGSVADLVAAFGSLVDERASPEREPIPAGAPYLQPTEERRRSGSHYTPRSLTEPIVRYALEPAFERIGERASPEAVLSLKVCDPACGSGAFLVEACRQLGARLERAWDMHADEKPAIPSDEDEATHARRLVAQRCLYGVDRNPMAVDLARLSLWLATLAREHEFSFLDHALKSGDSLVGLTMAEIKAAHWDASKPGLPLFREVIAKAVARATEGREAIRTAGDDVLTAAQAARHRRVEEEMQIARDVGDAVVAAFFSTDRSKDREKARQTVESWIGRQVSVDWNSVSEEARRFHTQQSWRPFHWEIEFPEVFVRENPGFDSIVGNPPFLGGRRISVTSGDSYLAWLLNRFDGSHGNADLVAYFFRLSFDLLRIRGKLGLVATNSICQGDSRGTGLAAIIKRDGRITNAERRHKWPGDAAVIVSIVHIQKVKEIVEQIADKVLLNGRPVSRISAFLVAGSLDKKPAMLHANSEKGFIGSVVLGMGFTFDDSTKKDASSLSDMQALITHDTRNLSRIKPYLGGDEVNNEFSHQHRRWVIDFEDFPLERNDNVVAWSALTPRERDDCRRTGIVPVDYPGAVSGDWAELLRIVQEKVKPERDKSARDAYRKRWWLHAERAKRLYPKVSSMQFVLAVNCGASPHLAVARVAASQIFANTLVVFAFDKFSAFSLLQSRPHEIWARFFSSSMKDDLRYACSDCFETFPFAAEFQENLELELAGQSYHDHRAALMIAAQEGMTKIYNRFHLSEDCAPAIIRLRELHDAIDRAVLRAYGWDDLAETLRPEFLTPETEDDHTYQGRYFWPAAGRDLVLSRLLALNAERHAEEVAAGLVPVKGRARSTESETGESLELFDDA